MNPKSLNKIIEDSIKKNWDCPALSDYNGVTLYYRDVARRIEKIHIMLETCGLQRGDKIAICGRNSACWAVAFLATLTYGAVAVPVQHEFTPEQVYNVVNHSEAKLLFVGDRETIRQAFNVEDVEDVVFLPKIMSRKKQVIPMLSALWG